MPYERGALGRRVFLCYTFGDGKKHPVTFNTVRLSPFVDFRLPSPRSYLCHVGMHTFACFRRRARSCRSVLIGWLHPVSCRPVQERAETVDLVVMAGALSLSGCPCRHVACWDDISGNRFSGIPAAGACRWGPLATIR